MSNRNAELIERLSRIERLFGPLEEGQEINMVQQLASMAEEIQTLRTTVGTFKADIDALGAELGGGVQLVREDVQKLHDRHKAVKADVRILRQVVGTQDVAERGRKRIPEPKPFNGARCAKELENFLWDMDEYFSAAKVGEEEKVSMAAMYLADDAKLWWRTRVSEDAIAGRSRIETWDNFKQELKSQFLPGNTSWQAREAMKNLKQTGSVKDYVKEFCALLLNVRNMSEDDKLFNFESGLKSWAQQELRRQNVKDLKSAFAAAEALVDYRAEKTVTDAAPSKNKKGKGVVVIDDEQPHEKRTEGGGKWKGKPHEGSSKSDTRNKGCFLCDGPHRARECPKREKLNALLVEEGQTGKGQDHESGSELQLLNTIVSLNNVEILATLTEDVDLVRQKLMQVAISVNGRDVVAMVDTGATHTVVSATVVQRLGLRTSKCNSLLKMPNAKAQSVHGMAYNVPLKVGSLTGKINMLVIPLDDFDVILGMDFLKKTQSCPMPYLNGLMVTHQSGPCFVPCVGERPASTKKMETVSAMTVEKGKGKKAGPVAYLAALSKAGAKTRVGSVSRAGLSRQQRGQSQFRIGKVLAGRESVDNSTRASNSGGLGGLLDP